MKYNKINVRKMISSASLSIMLAFSIVPMNVVNAANEPELIAENQAANENASYSATIKKVAKDAKGISFELDVDGKTRTLKVLEDFLFLDEEGIIKAEDLKAEDKIIVKNYDHLKNKTYSNVIIKGTESGLATVTLAIFDEDMLSEEKDLVLKTSEKTIIEDVDGKQYEGELSDKLLAVYSKIYTNSLPAQTTADKIIVIENLANKNELMSLSKIADIKVDKKLDKETIEVSNADVLTHLKITDDTILVDDSGFIKFDSIKIGDKLSAYYDANKPMTMIYPAQINIKVLVKEKDNAKSDIIVSKFDENLLSYDKSLKLNINKANPVFGKNGKPYAGELENKELVVFSNAQTFSIPAQTTPTMIIVIDELPENKVADGLGNVEDMSITIDGKVVDGARAYKNEDDVFMLPLRPIAEALDYKVTWDAKERTATLGVAIVVKIDSNEFIVGRMAPIELDAKAVIKDGQTYVPLKFFTDVLHLDLDLLSGNFTFKNK